MRRQSNTSQVNKTPALLEAEFKTWVTGMPSELEGRIDDHRTSIKRRHKKKEIEIIKRTG